MHECDKCPKINLIELIISEDILRNVSKRPKSIDVKNVQRNLMKDDC